MTPPQYCHLSGIVKSFMAFCAAFGKWLPKLLLFFHRFCTEWKSKFLTCLWIYWPPVSLQLSPSTPHPLCFRARRWGKHLFPPKDGLGILTVRSFNQPTPRCLCSCIFQPNSLLSLHPCIWVRGHWEEGNLSNSPGPQRANFFWEHPGVHGNSLVFKVWGVGNSRTFKVWLWIRQKVWKRPRKNAAEDRFTNVIKSCAGSTPAVLLSNLGATHDSAALYKGCALEVGTLRQRKVLESQEEWALSSCPLDGEEGKSSRACLRKEGVLLSGKAETSFLCGLCTFLGGVDFLVCFITFLIKGSHKISILMRW